MRPAGPQWAEWRCSHPTCLCPGWRSRSPHGRLPWLSPLCPSTTLPARSSSLPACPPAGTCALYRQLLRLCAQQRAALCVDAAPADPLLPHLNILITLAGAFFGQDEELAAMWEEDEE